LGMKLMVLMCELGRQIRSAFYALEALRTNTVWSRQD